MKYFLGLLLLCILSCRSDKQVPKYDDPIPKTSSEVLTQELASSKPIKSEIIPLDYDSTLWTDIANFLPEVKLDIRYATENNFVKEVLYDCPRCWLRPDAAKALKQVSLVLKKQGFGLVMFDCYRPRPVQQRLWDIMPNAAYVTPPERGSMHNRGKAVDLSLTDLDGNQLDMGTPFDYFGKPAHVDFRDHPADILDRRDLLTSTMQEHGFHGIRTEWWHFSYGGKPAELSAELWKCN